MSFELFSATLPDQGRYCIATLLPPGGKKKFNHDWFEDKRAAYDFAMLLSANKPDNIYYAMGVFDDSGFRKKVNCKGLKSFFLDIDCGEKKPYPNQKEGLAALLKFCNQTDLPVPTVVNSGNGLYAIWIMDESVEENVWSMYGNILKGVCHHYGFQIDTMISANSAQVLRPVGSFNRKNGGKKPVTIVGGAIRRSIPFVQFSDQLGALADKLKLQPKSFGAPKPVEGGINSEFDVSTPISERPSAHKLAERCNQIKLMRDSNGDIAEPHWYACIGVLKCTMESPEIIHKWSEGHTGYNHDETDNKIEQYKYHATRCEKFYDVNPSGCAGCPYHSKLNSPWSLGLPDPKPIDSSEDDSGVEYADDLLPYRFSRTDKGIIHTDEDGAITVVYKYDIVPVGVFHDLQSHRDVMRLKVKLPFKGWTEVIIRCADTEDKKALSMALIDAGVYVPTGKDERSLFYVMIRNYMDTLIDKRRKIDLTQQMGWVDHAGRQAFVLGDKLITEKGVETVGIAAGADSVIKSISSAGDLDTWTEQTRMLNKAGLEPWAFTLAALGFGAPLMKVAGYKGSLLSMVGESGRGKTAMGWWALSIWGNPEKLQMIQRDTHNATIMRMSVYNNLPLFIDEITNIKPDELSNLAYQITQGRDKLTLTKDRKEREGLEWATIGAASSNKSLVDALSGLKANASAEINRIFEYEFPAGQDFDGKAAYRMFLHNYGLVGEVYVKYLVDHQDEHRAKLTQIQEMIEREADCRPEERFWTVTASCALYGAFLAQKLGLFHVNLPRLKSWIISTIRAMRGEKDDTVENGIAWLGAYLNKYITNTLVIDHTAMENGNAMIHLGSQMFALRGALLIRRDEDSGLVYISQKHLLKELQESSMNKRVFRAELEFFKALKHVNHKVTLSKGVKGLPSVQENCWVIDTTIPALSGKLALVKPVAEATEREAQNG